MQRQVILDTETTGLDVKSGHRIIEIGCIELVNRRFSGAEFQTYVNPEREIDEGAERVHGLSSKFLSDKPRFEEIFEEFADFIRGSELLIHNAEFDLAFLDHEIKLLPGSHSPVIEIVDKVIDTLQLAREKHPGQLNSLDALIQRYKITGYQRKYHGALLDSKILGDVYLTMTGGQGDLIFKEGPYGSKNDTVLKSKTENSITKLREISLSTEEEEMNLNYLNRMKDETGKKPLWLKRSRTDGCS